MGSILYSLVRGLFTSRKMPGLLAKVNTADLEILAGLLRSAKVTPALDRTYNLGETAEAIRYLEQGHVRGKVAITVP
jgi:NADPH:quinone reductase-like Zn-dependent oxidoreductase